MKGKNLPSGQDQSWGWGGNSEHPQRSGRVGCKDHCEQQWQLGKNLEVSGIWCVSNVPKVSLWIHWFQVRSMMSTHPWARVSSSGSSQAQGKAIILKVLPASWPIWHLRAKSIMDLPGALSQKSMTLVCLWRRPLLEAYPDKIHQKLKFLDFR